MRRYELRDDINCIYFVSEKCRTWAPAKTIILLPPDHVSHSASRLADFAVSSGWYDAAEQDGAVLVLPVSAYGWRNESTDRIKKLYKAVWRDALSPDPGDVRGTVWCWETLIFLAGYDQGAVYAGHAAVDHPNAFAGVAMINGVPWDYSGGERHSDQWLLPDASKESLKKNHEIPVCVWFLGNEDIQRAEEYFKSSAAHPNQVTVTRGLFGADPKTTETVMREFSTRIRWKNSPDGTPARCLSEQEFLTSGEYASDYVDHNGFRYAFYTRVPAGIVSTDNMPVVISLHGHGEPAQLFCGKNGWPELSDETGEFLLVLPDSPENAWQVERDEGMFRLMIEKLYQRFHIDRARIYLTGFSNGAMATCWYGTRHPELFAAISPWNPPLSSFEADMVKEGWQMPLFAINGDKDHKVSFALKTYDALFSNFITLNGGKPRLAEVKKPMTWKCDEVWNDGNRYSIEKGYAQGKRLTTYVYHNLDGQLRVCYTEVKDMPHGAIKDEARASWSFLRRFLRPNGSRQVIDSEPTDYGDAFTFKKLPSGTDLLTYVPSGANSYTPSRSLIILPPASAAHDKNSAQGWLCDTGWIHQANKDASVLLVPISGGSWKSCRRDIVVEIYNASWAQTASREPGNTPWLHQAAANVWMWEVLWSIVGYQDGACFAGECAAFHPNRFASVTLIGGYPCNFPDQFVRSDHFLVSPFGKNPDRMIGVSGDYDERVIHVPSAVWIIADKAEMAGAKMAVSYFCHADSIQDRTELESATLGKMAASIWRNADEPAQRVALSGNGRVPSPQELMNAWIGPSVRWKNSPDGTLKTFWWKDQIESGESPFIRENFRMPQEMRDRYYYVYKPVSAGAKAPVLISIHGHGEPAWMFLSKNGWMQVADQEGVIIVSPQDNSENRWYGDTDDESFRYLVEDIRYKYDTDPERIYLSGFSNGNMQCYAAASKYPELFAAIFPMSRAATSRADLERFLQKGLEMPLFGVTGDNDGWIAENPGSPNSDISKTVETFLSLAMVKPIKSPAPHPMYWEPDEERGGEWYLRNKRFKEAERFTSWVYKNGKGDERVIITVMKNMPHGTIWEETFAAWGFMKHFKRKLDGRIETI